MPLSAGAASAVCSLRNGSETIGGRRVYTGLVELMSGYSLTGVTLLHTGGYYRGDLLRSADSEIGSNELALSLLLYGKSSDLWPYIRDTAGLLRGKGIVSVNKDEQRDVDSRPYKENVGNQTSVYPDFYSGSKMDVYVMESRQIEGIPMYQRIAEILRQTGAVWVSVTRAVDGFGMARSIKKTGWLWRRSEVPLLVNAVGTTESLQEAVENITRLPGFDGYVTVQFVSWYTP